MSEVRFYKQNTLPTLTENDAPPLPLKIGPYKIETLLAKGGMSLLYLGLDPKTREMRAVKVLSPAYVDHPEMVDHFLWEAKIISLTSHPNIVKVYDHGRWEGGLYIAMEFIRGISLSQFISQQSFSLKRTLSIVLQIAYALCHLHTHGVIHRDLKPENILMAEDGEIKVIDFGIAQLHDDLRDTRRSAPGQVMGTPSYMSPEQRDSSQQVTFASDIYALGIIAYELLTGKLSYGLVDLGLLPQGLQKIISKALAVSLQERYQDIVDFISDLTRYASSSLIEQERPISDRAMETLEILQQADLSLSPAELPHWPELSIGVARHRLPGQLGLYSDFFKFANQTYGLVLVQTLTSSPAAPVSLGILKGMIHALVKPLLERSSESFSPARLASSLSTLLLEEKIKERFALAFLKLVPQNDTLTFLSCGFGPLLHLPRGAMETRILSNHHAPIGSPPLITYDEITDTWREGDLLVFHSLSEEQLIDPTPLCKALQQEALLSPLRLAEHLLKDGLKQKGMAPTRHPSLLYVLERIT